MNYGYLVEECHFLTPQDVRRGSDRIHKIGVNKSTSHSCINYWLDNIAGIRYLFVSVDGREPQKFALESVTLTFGETDYFLCGCGYRAKKLYLPPNSVEFKCRKCHNLKYELSVLNRKSVAGKSIYIMTRMHKLANSRANISRIFYNGNYTKRFERFLRLCERAGLDNIVNGANDLKKLVNG